MAQEGHVERWRLVNMLLRLPALAGLIVFGGFYAVFRLVSLSSLLAALTAAIAAFVLLGPGAQSALAAGAAALIVWRHRANVMRLVRRQEKRLQRYAARNQWRDVVQVLRVSGPGMDPEYLDRWAAQLGLETELERARDQARLPGG